MQSAQHITVSLAITVVFSVGVTSMSACGIRRTEPMPVATETISNSKRWIGILGDSGVTGALASPRFTASLSNLGQFVIDDSQSDARKEDIPNAEKYNILEDSPAPLTRIRFSQKERRETHDIQMQATERASEKIDVNQYSWAYLVGRKLGIPPSDMVMVAQDGTRVDALSEQFQRLKDFNANQLPPLILISFNANDLCDEKILNEPSAQVIERYAQTIREQMTKSLDGATAHPESTNVVVLAPFDITNAFSNPELLKQKIEFQGRGQVECRDLRVGQIQGTLTRQTRDRILGMCNAVLETKPDDTERIRKLSELSQGFADAWARLVGEFNQTFGAKNIEFRFSDSTRRAQFQTGDLANDCFHPGARAHTKIADEVLAFLGQADIPLVKK